MTVKQLIEKLQEMPQDLQVVAYTQISEADGMITKVKVAHRDKKYSSQAEEYYCNGDSEPACNGIDTWVVIGDMYM